MQEPIISFTLYELQQTPLLMCSASDFRKHKRGKGNVFAFVFGSHIVTNVEAESVFDELKYKRAFVFYHQIENRIYITKFEPMVKAEVIASLYKGTWNYTKQSSPKQ